MTRIGDVWDGATDVLAGRAGPLAALAAIAFVAPSVAQSAAAIYGGPAPGAAALAALFGLVALITSLWGQLAIIAIASDPATTRAEAGRAAIARLPAALLVALLLAGAALLLAVPPVIALGASGYDFAAASAYRGAGAMPAIAPSAMRFLLIYAVAVIVGFLWLSARLFLANTVILNERRGVGALGRSIELTRGLTWKLIGVALLFGVTLFVTQRAVQPVVGLAARLALGPDGAATARFLAAVAGAILFAAFMVVVQVFAARLYAAIVAGRA